MLNVKANFIVDTSRLNNPCFLWNAFRLAATTKQNPEYHPEGDVATHTALMVGAMIHGKEVKEMLYAGLFHDLGKISTTAVNMNGKITSHGHELFSVEILEKNKDLIPDDVDYETVLFIVKNHMRYKYRDEMREAKREAILSHQHVSLLRRFSVYDNAKKFFETTTEKERELYDKLFYKWAKEEVKHSFKAIKVRMG